MEVAASMVGEILTVQEAGGFQMNIAKWDDEFIRLWNTPATHRRTARSKIMADNIGNKAAHDYHLDIPAAQEGFYVKGSAHCDWGMKNRLGKMFDPRSGNTVMLAFDHGYIMSHRRFRADRPGDPAADPPCKRPDGHQGNDPFLYLPGGSCGKMRPGDLRFHGSL